MVLKPDLVRPETQHHPLSHDALHAISTEFLASEKLAHAPLAEKKEFLKTKGLSEDEIETLLQRAAMKGKGKEVAVDLEASSEASSSRVSTPVGSDAETTTEEMVENNEEKGLVPKELKEIRPSPPPSPRLKPTPIEPTYLQQPLIVTYPEFLAPPPQPPAPITAKSLLSTLYYSAATATTIYAGSKYILQPMYDQLTEARTDLAKTALTNLTQFNDKLSALVPSHVRPAFPSPHVTSSGFGRTEEEAPIAGESDDEGDDASSTSSVRTHLFHVDASTQTMPDPLSNPLPSPTSEEKISTITSHLTTLIDSNSDGADGELQYELEALTTYLETLRVDPKDLFPWSGSNTGTVGADGKEDLTMTVKREIRSVKGVLLNSKNFPGGR
ncbi:hypothetical protein L211DRAFT_852500 [Terfezia boudieri ATCC MYA-4762]|uniref:Peroxisome membrane anchor protein Pex14p N-terminal domain-containing protein n=1 Tax=Terfezia boudieri ATCC MYA-4762 TaxID=1051890 RepID=A0A3N4LEX7_9PEZI|nr:hypothetical protein L211DRAFT_852500 [Terfezia boudieri ATCC MYA-4762]